MEFFGVLFECIDIGVSCDSIFEDRGRIFDMVKIFAIDIFVVVVFYWIEIPIVVNGGKNGD